MKAPTSFALFPHCVMGVMLCVIGVLFTALSDLMLAFAFLGNQGSCTRRASFDWAESAVIFLLCWIAW
jgi:hypothetical protein